ncbi:uncharacterized protein LOC111702442 [Eurytemora carolleeae]|uniref:uncharacterized protein LOC111702442 n=1 Tax=Eurytemora carolleeae TaxID=1294199 RepID=UPI000C76BA76|nr:uncharacterized protein LOC111702442 [Eurytemora carolleeae]|eukprot:XP_023329896.1 uncharacterized protein LOC111702442 [Eurytemora affinis]
MKKITLYILWTAKRESTPDDQNNLIIPGPDAIKRSVQAYPDISAEFSKPENHQTPYNALESLFLPSLSESFPAEGSTESFPSEGSSKSLFLSPSSESFLPKTFSNSPTGVESTPTKEDKTTKFYLRDGRLVTQELLDTLYEAISRIHLNQTEAENRQLDLTGLTNLVSSIDLTSLTNIFNFITRNLDWVAAVGVIKHLENRAAYDPRFRESFPDFLQDSDWFLPPKKYKLVPRKPGTGNQVLLSNKLVKSLYSDKGTNRRMADRILVRRRQEAHASNLYSSWKNTSPSRFTSFSNSFPGDFVSNFGSEPGIQSLGISQDQVFDQERDQEQKQGFKQDVGNRIIYGAQGPSNYRGRPAFLQDGINGPNFPPGPGPNKFQKPGSLSSNLSKLNRGPLVQDLGHQMEVGNRGVITQQGFSPHSSPHLRNLRLQQLRRLQRLRVIGEQRDANKKRGKFKLRINDLIDLIV